MENGILSCTAWLSSKIRSEGSGEAMKSVFGRDRRPFSLHHVQFERDLNFQTQMIFAFLVACALSRSHEKTDSNDYVTTDRDSGVSDDAHLADRVLQLREMLDKRLLSKKVRSEVKTHLSGIGLTNDLISKAQLTKNLPAELSRLARNYKTTKAQLAKRLAAKRRHKPAAAPAAK